jgi:hypothetical protein
MATKKLPPKKAVVKKASPLKKVVKEAVVKSPKVQQTIGFDEETKQLFRDLIAALQPQQISVNTEAVKIVKHKEEPVKTKADDTGDDDDKPVPLSRIRELIQDRASNGKTNAVLKALKKYGVGNATDLDEDNYRDFYNDLLAI